MPTFFLHAGMHKTGTTSLQRWLNRHRAAVRTAGIEYPELGRHNHSGALAAILTPERGGPPDTAAAVAEALTASSRAALEANRDLLLSAEIAPFLGERALAELLDRFAVQFDKRVALLLLRPPLSFIAASVQQTLNAGLVLDNAAAVGFAVKYRQRIVTLRNTFGSDRVRLALYHRDAMPDGDAIAAALALMGRAGEAFPPRGERANRGKSLTAAKLMSEVSRSIHAGRLSHRLPREVRGALEAEPFAAMLAGCEPAGDWSIRFTTPIRRVIGRVKGPRFALPREIAAATADDSAREVDWVRSATGIDLARWDAAADGLPALDAFRTFDRTETETIMAELAAFAEAHAAGREAAYFAGERTARRGWRRLTGLAPR